MDEILIVLVLVCLAIVASHSLEHTTKLDDAVVVDGKLVWKQIQLSAK